MINHEKLLLIMNFSSYPNYNQPPFGGFYEPYKINGYIPQPEYNRPPYVPQPGYDRSQYVPQQGYDRPQYAPQQGYDRPQYAPQQGYDLSPYVPQQGYEPPKYGLKRRYDSPPYSPQKQNSSFEEEAEYKMFHPHPLIYRFRNNWKCDFCGNHFQNKPSYNCFQCDYDVCITCYEK